MIANPGAARHIALPGTPKEILVTDPARDLEQTEAELPFCLPAKSVVTLIFED